MAFATHKKSIKANKAARRDRGCTAFEPLEARQLFSVGTDAIASEYFNTMFERDAYGTSVHALLGNATSAVVAVPGVNGALMQTYNDNGTIYWSSATGAHVVLGAIGAKYNATASETNAFGQSVKSVLGLPTSDEFPSSAVSGGRYNTFQGGDIIWTGSTGAHAVIGAIATEYNQTGNERDVYGNVVQNLLGAPTSDELATVGYAGGRVSDFANGQIYWSPNTGAHVIYGAGYTEYSKIGGSTSWLGLPTVDEFSEWGSPTTRFTDFENGDVSWSPTTGPAIHQTGVSVTARNGHELDVNLSGKRDVLTVSQSGGTLVISGDGQTWFEPVPAFGLSVFTHGGTDTVTLAAGVTARTTLVSIDGSISNLHNNTGSAAVQIWADNNDTVWGPGVIHRVTSFAGGTSKAEYAALANPKDAGAATVRSGSLFGYGPTIGDVNQRKIGDCYFMAEIAGLAAGKPQEIEDSVVDMGDGTYAVQFFNGKTPEFVRVNASLSGANSTTWTYATPGANGNLWAPIVEKAYAYFKTGANTYASIDSGNGLQSTGAFGLTKESIYPSSMTDATFAAEIIKRLGQGQSIIVDVADKAPNVVNDHFYTVTAVIKTASGYQYQVRNPWGYSGSKVENSTGYAWLTFAQMQKNFSVADITLM